MATAALPERPRRKRKSVRPPGGWWGVGAAPWERWPGATIRIDATWNGKRERWESHDGTYYFDTAEAARAVEFFPEYLRHHIGEFAGRAFTLMDYQRLLLTAPIFGWKRAGDGTRRFRKVFAFLPKGAGKSPWGAGTGLYLTLCDNEPAAEVYAVAADKHQARVVFDNAKVMVEESPDLEGMCEVLRDSIYHADSRSSYKVLSSDAATKHGFRPHGVIFDEFHAQPNRDLYEALKKSMVKRRQPLMILITHSGHDDEGICYEEYEYAKKVLSGTVPDETCLPVIFEATDRDDWTDPRVWARVNPGHGVTVKHDAIAAECEEAKAEPRKRNDFLRFHLNRWVNQATAWLPVDWWDRCEDALEDSALRQFPVYAGIDMSQKHDLTSCVLTFVAPMDGPVEEIEVVGGDRDEIVKRKISLNFEVAFVPFFWIPEATMREHERSDRVPYSQWVADGLVTATEGNVIDYDRIVDDIAGPISRRFPRLKGAEIGYDPAFATDIALKLRSRGFQTVEILQNYKYLSEPAHIFESLVKGERVHHSGHRVLRWNVENVAVKRDDAGRIRPVKPRRQTKRIDGVVAALMGLSRALLQPVQSRRWRPL